MLAVGAVHLTAFTTLAALLLYFVTGLRVGRARGRFGVQAPATSGHPEFERHFRVQMNTLEWLALFLPSLWLFCAYWGDVWAALLGMVWIVGRWIYMVTYVADPKTRTAGFAIQGLATLVLWAGALIGVAWALFASPARTN